MIDLFEFEDYKSFLNEKLDDLDKGGRGSRARMSRFIGCQTAYTAQVLRGSAHLSLEQAEAINEFLGHTEDQGAYFLLLIQWQKAGTQKLRMRFRKQLDDLRKSRAVLKNRLEVPAHLTEHYQMTYYSSWIFGAIHALVSIPGFQDAEKIGERLGLEVRQVSEALDFLFQARVLEKTKKGEIKIGTGQIHLGTDSPLVRKHHLNWRLQAMMAIEKNLHEGLHYSSVVSISKKDRQLIHQKLIEYLKELKAIVRDSKEEELCSLSFDFFEL
jgi:uncharacterized protein (TIGR02147 family)